MYALPDIYGARDCLQHVDKDKVEVCLEECVFKDFPCEEDVFHLCVDLMSEHNLDFSNDVFDTVDLYVKLRQVMLTQLELLP